MLGGTDGKARRRIANLLEILEVAVCMTGFAFRRRTEYRRDIR